MRDNETMEREENLSAMIGRLHAKLDSLEYILHPEPVPTDCKAEPEPNTVQEKLEHSIKSFAVALRRLEQITEDIRVIINRVV